MQVALGQIDPDTGKPIDYFKAIYNTYEKNALTFLGYGDPNNAWQQAAYIAQIQDFTEIAMERGFAEALNMYGAGFFNAVAVNSIVTSGMSIGQYFASKLAAGQYTLKIDPKTGSEYKEVGIGQDGEYGAGLFTGDEETGYTLRGKTEKYGDTSFWGFGDVAIDAYGKMGFTDAELMTAYGDIWGQHQTIDDGLQVYADVVDLREAGRQLFTVTPDELLGYNAYGLNGEYIGVKINDIFNGTLVNIGDDIFMYQSLIGDFDNTFEDDDLSWLSEYGLDESDFDTLTVGQKVDAEGNASVEFYWESAIPVEDPWNPGSVVSLWANNPEFQERMINKAHWRGYRTNTEIETHLLNEYESVKTYGQTGDMIFVNGNDGLADLTKNVTQGPVNHVGMLYVDSNGEKWVLEMLKGTGLQKIKLSEFMVRQVVQGNDIKIGRKYGLDVNTFTNTVKSEFFITGTENVKDIPYNTANLLFAVNGSSETSFICSGMVEYVYRKANSPIFTGSQLQYSPVDTYNEIDKIGYKY